jgi:hypothetical protein
VFDVEPGCQLTCGVVGAEDLLELRAQLDEEAEFSAQALERAQNAEAEAVRLRSELASLKVGRCPLPLLCLQDCPSLSAAEDDVSVVQRKVCPAHTEIFRDS